MSQPRDLATTLPSPSELNNYHKCPCYWYLHDRLWIKPVGDRLAFLMGRLLDKAMEKWLLKEITSSSELLKFFDELTQEHVSEFDLEEYSKFASSTRDAIVAWLVLYGNITEEIISVQSKFVIDAPVKVDYLIRIPPGLIRVRERKLISPFADIDIEVAKYQLGFQPLSYAEQVEKAVGMPVEAVEFEFFIRSAPAYGKKKPIPASIRREPIYVVDWKKRIWLNSAEFTNYCMRTLEDGLSVYDELPFEMLPRHTMNCITKLGQKTYECDYYKACKTNTNPLLMAENFYQSGGKKHGEGNGESPGTSETVSS